MFWWITTRLMAFLTRDKSREKELKKKTISCSTKALLIKKNLSWAMKIGQGEAIALTTKSRLMA